MVRILFLQASLHSCDSNSMREPSFLWTSDTRKGTKRGPKGTKRSRNVSRLCARSDCTKKPTGRKSSITAALQLSSFCCQELCLVLSSVPLPTLQENSLAMMKLNISKPTTAARAIHAGAHAPLAIYNSVAISRTESAHMEVFRAVCLFGIHW